MNTRIHLSQRGGRTDVYTPTNKQLLAVGITTGVIVTGSVVGIIALEKKREIYAAKIVEMERQRQTLSIRTYEPKYISNQKRDAFGSTSPDPENPVITEQITDRVDTILPESVAKMGHRFAQTKSHRYLIYADNDTTRPGDWDIVYVDYFAEGNLFTYNGFICPPQDIQDMFGSDFTEEIVALGMGVDLTLIVYSTVLIGNNDSFYKIVLNFHKEGLPMMEDEVLIIPDDEEDMYDPDAPPIEEDVDPEEADEIAIQELLDAEEIDHGDERVFNPDAPIDLDATGELSEEDLIAGWTTVECTFRMTNTGMIHDENDVPIPYADAIDWFSKPIFESIVLSPNLLEIYPDRTIYVANGQLKIMYEITIE